MSENAGKSKRKVGRRGFLKSAVASGVAGIAASSPILAAQKQAGPQTGCRQFWEIPPPPIPGSEIRETCSQLIIQRFFPD